VERGTDEFALPVQHEWIDEWIDALKVYIYCEFWWLENFNISKL